MSDAPNNSSKGPTRAIRVALIAGEAGAHAPAGAPPSVMFDARDVRADGAFLAGPLLLEVNEEVNVRLAFADGDTVDARARVDQVVRGDGANAPAGMVVSFTSIDDANQRTLERKLAD